MLRPTIKLTKTLYARVKKWAEATGYSSPDEFVEHLLERELRSFEDSESEEEITRKLKGLGYLD